MICPVLSLVIAAFVACETGPWTSGNTTCLIVLSSCLFNEDTDVHVVTYVILFYIPHEDRILKITVVDKYLEIVNSDFCNLTFQFLVLFIAY